MPINRTALPLSSAVCGGEHLTVERLLLRVPGVITALVNPASEMAYVEFNPYLGFILVMLGFLVQWPTLFTLLMFPVLVLMYVRLARREERELRTGFGAAYARHHAATPAFLPRFARPVGPTRIVPTQGASL
jgi:hypothetical protein